MADAAKPRILVVDDNEDAAWVLSELLVDLGHQVETALDGTAALARVEQFEPDVALLDIGLPGMSGFDLARRMRARLPKVFLVAVTGYGQAADREATREAGFDAHLVKPLEVEDVVRIIAVASSAPR